MSDLQPKPAIRKRVRIKQKWFTYYVKSAHGWGTALDLYFTMWEKVKTQGGDKIIVYNGRGETRYLFNGWLVKTDVQSSVKG